MWVPLGATGDPRPPAFLEAPVEKVPTLPCRGVCALTETNAFLMSTGERSADFLQRGVSGVSHLHVSVLGARKLLAVSAWRRAGACPVTPTRTPQSGKSHVLAPPAGLLELWWKRRSELRFSSTASLLQASAQQVVGAPRAALLYGQEDQR